MTHPKSNVIAICGATVAPWDKNSNLLIVSSVIGVNSSLLVIMKHFCKLQSTRFKKQTNYDLPTAMYDKIVTFLLHL